MFALLTVAALALDVGRAWMPYRCEECELAVTVQIHDYARVRDESLARASDIVSRLYGKIGVRTEWIGVVRPRERRTDSDGREGSRRSQIGQVTILVLTPQMADRGRMGKDVLGLAAVPEEGMGRIAYVIYDRVRASAAAAAMNEIELLGFVMAHEIGHLLLPRGSHLKDGVMKGHLERRDLQQLDVRTMEFTATEASQIRDVVKADSRRALPQ
jgi:hypothetical protein